MSQSSPSAVLRYYRDVWELILRHSARGQVLTAISAEDPTLIPTTVTTPEELIVGSGPRVGLFLADPHALVLRIRPGDGADVATAATTALDLAEQVVADGGLPVPLTDGSGGLLVMSRASGDVRAAAQRYAAGIAVRAPELATLDLAQADGRCVVQTGWSAHDVGAAPVPYSLVLGPEGPAPVIPLHLDEVAAVAAGMPLELGARDVADRVATRGDLAAALLDVGTA